jgi:adenosylcobalamin-dependent ribonucleoside-triphosphate reductase
MNAFQAIATLKGCKRPKWWQTMYVDHYMAESVLVGGARRSARIAVKHWRDPDILEFITMKNKLGNSVPLWSANNSVGVDNEFWNEHLTPGTWANRVYVVLCYSAYYNKTGEPVVINLHKLEVNEKKHACGHIRVYGSDRYQVTHGLMLLSRLEQVYSSKRFKMIVNPCAEITLSLLGGYCVIGDIALYHCDSLYQAEEAVRLTVRALIRTNLMDCVYKYEVQRTNRIGVSLTSIHEFAWKFFKLGFRDLLDAKKSVRFWDALTKLSKAVKDESEKYAKALGVNIPHTCTTIKPAGTTSKLFGLTEGAHLPSMREFIRWVQFRTDDPLVAKYKKLGYPTKELRDYDGTSIVGFPTQPIICTLNMGDKLVTAPEATPEEQYQYLMLLEHAWLNGGDSNCHTGNQISYTLKYNCADVSYDKYCELFSKYQRQIRCCSIMPTCEDDSAYEYLPEEAVNLETYNKYVTSIKQEIEEDVDKVHIDCKDGACPIDFNFDGKEK